MNSKNFDPDALKRATRIIDKLPNSNSRDAPEQPVAPPNEYLDGIMTFGPPGQGKPMSGIKSHAQFLWAPFPEFQGHLREPLVALKEDTANEQDTLDVKQVFELLKKHIDNPSFTTGNLATQMKAVYAAQPSDVKLSRGIDGRVALEAVANVLNDPAFHRAITKSDGSTHRVDISNSKSSDTGHWELLKSMTLIANVNAAKTDPNALRTLLKLENTSDIIVIPSTEGYSDFEKIERFVAHAVLFTDAKALSRFPVYGDAHSCFGIVSKIKKDKTYSDDQFNAALDLRQYTPLPLISDATLAVAALGSSQNLELFKKKHVEQFAQQFSTATYDNCFDKNSTRRVELLRLLVDTQSEQKPLELIENFDDSLLDLRPAWRFAPVPVQVNEYCREKRDITENVLSFVYTPDQIKSMVASNHSVSLLNGAKHLTRLEPIPVAYSDNRTPSFGI